MTSVLICEDSKTYATVLSRAVHEDGELEVVAVCSTAEQAIALLPKLKPDLVTMDIELPGISGMQAVEQIMDAHPVPILVLSSLVQKESVVVAEALAAGALDALGKGDLDLVDPRGATAVAFRSRLKMLSKARVIRHPRAGLSRAGNGAGSHPRAASVIGICASTGGPQAVASVLCELPAEFPIPIVVVQHIGAGFTEGLARWLDSAIALPVRLAEPAALEPGVWVAPYDAHVVLHRGGRLALDPHGVPSPHRPSGDTMLRSLAEAAGMRSVGIVLTGMGRDGAEGVAAIRAAGGLTIAQDRDSSAVFGMPGAAAAKGVELVLPPAAIGELLSGLVEVAA